MPIRPRLTDPYSTEYVAITKRKTHGPTPTAPRKPSAVDRKSFEEALNAIPISQEFEPERWHRSIILPLMKRKFPLYGVELAIYPGSQRTMTGKERCTCVLVMMLTPNRRNQKPSIKLSGKDKKIWYGRIINWIQETVYGDA